MYKLPVSFYFLLVIGVFLALASDTQTMYRHPQFNMVIHGYTYGDISLETINLDDGVIWVSLSVVITFRSLSVAITEDIIQ